MTPVYIALRRFFLTISFLSCPRSFAGPDQQILTKGDNNDQDDIGLYGGPRWLTRKQIVGKVTA